VRFTIERLRTLVLVAGVLLIGALVVFLARGRLKNPLNLKELPQKLGVNITSDANGFTLDHSFGGHSRYRIHASKAVQYKDNHAILHDVKIELYGEDQSRVDRIEGAEFDYDKQHGTAQAAGPVEITLMRPGAAPAIAPKASAATAAKGKLSPIASAAQTAERGEIHVKTSGLLFDTQSGVATTSEHVDFSMAQGSGSSQGASYDSKQGFLVLDRDVDLNTMRSGQTVTIRAQHAEFARDTHLCKMHQATADYRGGKATAGDANVLFRDDGSAVHLDAMNGFNLTTATGGHIAAPTGSMDFDEHNQPRHGHLEGGVTMDSTREAADGSGQRTMQTTAPTAELEFTDKGELRHAHLQRGVHMHSEQLTEAANGPLHVTRTWTSPIADVEFRDNGKGQTEPATIHGVEGVVITGESQRGRAAPEPSRLVADEVTGTFGPNSALKEMTGTGHATMEQTSASGARQNASGDRIEAQFVEHEAGAGKSAAPGQAGASQAVASQTGASQIGASQARSNQAEGSQIQSAVLDGHVVLTQTPAPKPPALATTQPGAATQAAAPVPLQAWAGHAVYEGTGAWLRLTINPRVEDGLMQMTADKVDVSHETGDAFAHGNVKATWLNANAGSFGHPASGPSGQGGVALGGQGPAHVVAEEAHLRQATGETTFTGHARLWQQANSVSGPVLVLDRQRQTLVAHSSDPAEPVRAVLLSTGGLEPGAAKQSASGPDTVAGNDARGKSATGKSGAPSVIRVRGGDLKYSDAERRAVMRAGTLGPVIAETATATTDSDEVDLLLLPAGNHAGKDGGQAQVDRMTARGHVVVCSQGRRGTGEQLVYTGDNGDYVLTGTAAALPRMTDPARGNVTGEALIFHSRDDSVSIEGGGHRTTTETTAPK